MFDHLLDRFYRRNTDGYRVALIGLNGAGKTTMLYKLALGQVITTSPTIGLNVETVNAPTTSGRNLRMTCWDIGSCGRQFFLPQIRFYAACSDAIIWVVDSSDRSPEYLDESVEALGKLLSVLLSDPNSRIDKDIPVLILANKQDRAGAMTPFEVHNKFAATFAHHTFTVFPTCTTQDISIGGMPEAFNWLLYVLENPGSKRDANPPTFTPKPMPDPRSADVLSDKLTSWLSRAESDSAPDVFISQFEDISLPAWDHYTHIRIAYVVLTTHGRQKGKNMIFDGIERYIAKSAQAKGRTFHITMTYFWIQLVHFGIRSMPPMYHHHHHHHPSPAVVMSDPTNDSESVVTLVEEPSQKVADASPSLADFSAFLMLNPYVADGNLWADYYSKNVMMSPEAKAGVVLPDKKPLPNLVVRDTVMAQKSRAKVA